MVPRKVSAADDRVATVGNELALSTTHPQAVRGQCRLCGSETRSLEPIGDYCDAVDAAPHGYPAVSVANERIRKHHFSGEPLSLESSTGLLSTYTLRHNSLASLTASRCCVNGFEI